MRSWHPTYRVTTVSASQHVRFVAIRRLKCERRLFALCDSRTKPDLWPSSPWKPAPAPWLASAHWLWWEVNIWAHWDWAPRRHKLWPGQPGELEPGNPPLCFIHNNVPTFVNLTLKLTFWQAESINLLYICWGIWGVRKTHLARDPLRCVPSAGHWSLLSSLLSAPGPVSLMTLLVTSQWMASFLSNSLSPVLVIPRGPQSYRTKQFVFASDPGLKGYTYIILFDIFVSLQNLLRSIRREIVILLRCLYSKLKIRI